MGYTHSGILLSHKKNKIMSFARKWMDTENIMLSEISQSQKVKGRMFFSHIWKLGSNWNTRGTLDNEKEIPVE